MLKVKTDSGNYNIYFEKDFLNIKKAFQAAGLLNRKILIVTDSKVSQLYLKTVKDLISEFSLKVDSFIFNQGEESKTLDTVKEIYTFLAENLYDRKSVIIALGGGVTGDMAGFVSATYMRGVSYVQMPTTLLSQVDSSVGGKTGVDFLNNKNIIGAFYQPRFVYTNINTLNTLDNIQFSSGMGEVIKHGLIRNKSYYDYIRANKEEILKKNFEFLSEIVKGSCEIKADVVNKDEKESGLREVLNFGHTFGHAIESLSNFTLPHGHCVSIGSLCSLYISLDKNYISKEEYEDVFNTFKYFELTPNIDNFDTSQIIDKMYQDKKTKNNVLNIVILKALGVSETIELTDNKLVSQCIEYAKERLR